MQVHFSTLKLILIICYKLFIDICIPFVGAVPHAVTCIHLFKVKRSKNKILLVGWPYYEAMMHFVKSASTTATSVIGLSDSDVCKIFKSPFSPTVLIKVVIV